ncbi:MAG: N-acetylmuramoyl-L-alanine amidase, partial [Clostridiaceae bacterium]|nr:N-acetylmuramoyl-L-alanine amidase [Clostridiaceae bacterium]
SGVQIIKVYIDGTVVSMPALNVSRQDILNIFPGYTTDANCGFNTHINISKLAKGGHNIKVEVIGVDGTTSSVEREFYYKEKPAKTIVVDPGHNPGNIDRGARVNGYDETELNMEIASKLRKELKEKGYNVILTRDFGVSMSFSTVTESLDYKVNVANLINADLFISIHQNSNDNPSAHGTEVYYSTNDSQYGYISSKESKVAKSSQLASKVVNNISSNTGFYNRGPKDANFYVVRHSKMPSILVECGFISNPSEGAKLSNSSVQTSIAKAITNGVGSVQI